MIVDSEERGTTPTLSLYKNYFERTRRNTHGASRMLSDNLRSVNKELSTDVQRSVATTRQQQTPEVSDGQGYQSPESQNHFQECLNGWGMGLDGI